jgi:hypothetical protein
LVRLEQELAKLEEEIRAMKPKSEPIAPPVANVAIRPASKADSTAWKFSNRNSQAPPNTISSASISALVEVSRPPTPPKPHERLS